MTDSLNYEAVCITAPATPGLLISTKIGIFETNTYSNAEGVLSQLTQPLQRAAREEGLICYSV